VDFTAYFSGSEGANIAVSQMTSVELSRQIMAKGFPAPTIVQAPRLIVDESRINTGSVSKEVSPTRNIGLIVGLVVGLTMLVMICCCSAVLIYFYLYKWKRSHPPHNISSIAAQDREPLRPFYQQEDSCTSALTASNAERLGRKQLFRANMSSIPPIMSPEPHHSARASLSPLPSASSPSLAYVTTYRSPPTSPVLLSAATATRRTHLATAIAHPAVLMGPRITSLSPPAPRLLLPPPAQMPHAAPFPLDLVQVPPTVVVHEIPLHQVDTSINNMLMSQQRDALSAHVDLSP
jgi:hypothetical protein